MSSVGQRVSLRGQLWRVEGEQSVDTRKLLRLRSEESGEALTALCPPDEYTVVPTGPPALDRRALTPFAVWQRQHEALRLASPDEGTFAAFRAGRVQVEPYQFVPVTHLLRGPRRSLLLADDVGLGKTIEAGISLLELIARGVGKRILLVVPPGLIPQWLDEMSEKFGLEFHVLADAASVDQAQTQLVDGVQPWHFFDRVITSTEYLKRQEVSAVALHRPWDAIVVDEAHYLAESGTPAYPYQTLRTRLGARLREAGSALLLLTATPHNGHQHSFRSLLELVEPAEATLFGDREDVRRRVTRTMVRRLKSQITRTDPLGGCIPAFAAREPVQALAVTAPTPEERAIFASVSEYCKKAVENASESDNRDLVSFAMQIVKKRMLSSRHALKRTIANRLDALSTPPPEPPTRAELRELQSDLPLAEAAAERVTERLIRAAVSKEARARNAEKRQLKAIRRQLEALGERPDPKIAKLISHLEESVLSADREKVIVFTEYRDTVESLRTAFEAHAALAGRVVILTGGLTQGQRVSRIARFAEPDCRILLATDAASEGLNLQRHCRRVIHFELPWNPNRLEQRNGRVDRHGQRRNPILSYLFYADSPEDRVLDRLIQRIDQIHEDGVSTPDILGVLAATRLAEVLGEMTPQTSAEATADALIRTFETSHAEFTREVVPLLLAGSRSASLEDLDPTSADPVLDDDLELEALLLDWLGSAVRPTDVNHVFRIDVPSALQGAEVEPRYERATFRRSIAIAFPARDVEFIHRLHPLFRSVAARAQAVLTARDAAVARAPRIAVRRGNVEEPLAVFSFLHRFTAPQGALFAVALDARGRSADRSSMEFLKRHNGAVGEVEWSDLEVRFAPSFATVSEAATAAAREHVDAIAAREQERRTAEATVLRGMAHRYYDDRLSELAAQEAAERAGARAQMGLFGETRIDWDARRAAAATFRDARLREIDAWIAAATPVEPEPLGVLFVFPEN